MNTKTYRGSSLEECFTKVKSDMGGEAIILASRAFQPIFGRFGKTKHEVTATLDEVVAETSKPRPPMSQNTDDDNGGSRGVYGYSRGNKALHKSAQGDDRRLPIGEPSKLRMVDLGPARAIEIAEARTAELRNSERRAIEVRGLDEGRRIELRGEENDESAPRDPAVKSSRDRLSLRDFESGTTKQPTDDRMERLETQILSLSTNLQRLTDAAVARGKQSGRSAAGAVAPAAMPPEPPEARLTYETQRKRLIDAGVVEPLVRRLVDDIVAGLSDLEASEAVRTAIAGRMMLAGTLVAVAGKTQCVAFLGPSGVGKTTTLAKLAAKLTLVNHCKVAIVTMDTQRVGASRQIETFGEILRIPVKIAYDCDELAHHYEELAAQGYDFVLVDTTGKSPNDAIAIGEVARSLKCLPMLTKYLVVPATLSGANHDYVTGRFYSLVAPDAVILTKCDESADSSHFAHLMTAQAKFSVPVAYTTSGPRVPDDLSVADPHMMAEKLLSVG